MQIIYGDVKTWDLICSGYTKGIFQCESRLVQKWLKMIKPRTIWELSAVVAIVRPGALQSGFAQDYVDYKSGEKEYQSFGNDIIDEVFKINNGVLIYQENIMQLGARLAWCHLPEKERKIKVDILRKGIGKKNQEKLNEIGRDFTSSCIQNGLNEEIANKLFEIIKNCGRYLFNLSHSIKYAHVSYHTAYLKAHHPLQFYATYLTYAKFRPKKWEEVVELINEMRILGINILPININKKNFHFSIEDGNIRYGLSHMKFGPKDINDIGTFDQIRTWKDVIYLGLTNKFNHKMRSNRIEALISVGAFSDTGVSRSVLMSLYKFFKKLSVKEYEKLFGKEPDPDQLFQEDNESIFDTLSVDLNEFKSQIETFIESSCIKRRKEALYSELKLLKLDSYDNPSWVENEEKMYLGLGITTTSIDSKNIIGSDTCIECVGDFQKYTRKNVAVIISDVFNTVTKKGSNPGQQMARINVYDSTGNLENLPVFPSQYELYFDLLIQGNTVVLDLLRNDSGWIVDRIHQV